MNLYGRIPVDAPLTLDHVQVAAPRGCEAAARAFYGRLLGLTELDKPPALADRGGVWFALAGAELHVGVVDVGFAPATKAHPGLRVTDVAALEALAARLAAAGARVTWADPDEIPGVRRFHTADPWGNRLELLALESAPPAPRRPAARARSRPLG